MIIGISGKIGSGKDTVGKIIQYLIFAQNSEYKNDISFIYECVIDKNLDSYLLADNSGWEIKKFADKLKDMVCILLNCTREQLEDRDFKDKELGEEWWYFAETITHNKIPYLENKELLKNKFPVFKMTPRLLLQLLGTQCGRNIIHPNIWVNALISEYKSCEGKETCEYPEEERNWVITDMRFANELKAVEDKSGITIRVNRKKYRDDSLYIGEGFAASGAGLNQFDKAIEAELGIVEHASETALDNAVFKYTIENDGTIEKLIAKVKEILIKEKLLNV